MLFAVKVLGPQERRKANDGVGIDQQRSEDRFLGLEVLRRQSVDPGYLR